MYLKMMHLYYGLVLILTLRVFVLIYNIGLKPN